MFPVRSVALLKIRRRADLENSLFVEDNDIVDAANTHLETAYNACIEAYGDNVFADECVISGIPNVATAQPMTWPTKLQTRYVLPLNFGRLLRCEFVIGTVSYHSGSNGVSYWLDNGQSNIRWTPMHPIDLSGVVYDTTPEDWSEGRVGYWLNTNASVRTFDTPDPSFVFSIAFLPVLKSTVSVHIIYVPCAPQWGMDDTGYIKLPDIAWRYVQEATAADLVEQQRADSRPFRANAVAALAELKASKLEPDLANPMQTTDIYGGGNIGHNNGLLRNPWT
jgi:hypothetical protein